MRRSIMAGLLLATCFFSATFICASAFEDNFPKNLYEDSSYLKNESDRTLQNIVEGADVVSVAVHSSILKKSPVLTVVFSDQNSVTIPFFFDRQEKALAFKKLIFFLYKKSAQQDNSLFETHDFPHLILLAHEHQIDALTYAIAIFLHDQVQRKVLNFDEVILLDGLTETEILHLYGSLFNKASNKISDEYMSNIKESLTYYYNHLKYIKSSRVDHVLIPPSPAIYKKICDQQEAFGLANSKKRAEREEERRRAAFRVEVQNCADQIYQKWWAAVLKKGNSIEPYKDSADKEYSTQTVDILQTKLDLEFDVCLQPNIGRLKWSSNLCELCSEPCSLAFCMAQTAGWIGWTLLYIPQILTCDFFIPCCAEPEDRRRFGDCCFNTGAEGFIPHDCDECFCGSQSGAVIAHGVYNASTCCRRTILIKPKEAKNAELYLPKPPPMEEKEMVRD